MADHEQHIVNGDGDADEEVAPRARRRRPDAMDNLLRLLGQRVMVERREAAGNNDELVAGLKRSGMLNSEGVTKAMMTVPRGSFVPQEYMAEAWVDAPIRVEEFDFNISAPHMHAQMLESLDIQPGDRVLDVGCGCGIIAACAAVLAGKSGNVVGVDIKPAAIKLSTSNIDRLRETSNSFANSACAVSLIRHNVFIPSSQLKGKFNKVCVGATCPEDRLHLLLPLLDPAGGKLLAPVDNDLRLYTRTPEGKLRQRVVSSVRFSDLEVPSDASIVLSVLQEEASSSLQVAVSPPALPEDLAGHTDKGCAGGFVHMWSSCFTPSSSSEGPHSLGSSESLPGPDTPMQSAHPLLSAQSSKSLAATAPESLPSDDSTPGSECACADDASQGAGPGLDTLMSESPRVSGGRQVFGPEHGEPDCQLMGAGWKLWAHKAVLTRRAAHFRALTSSGMRDAHQCSHTVPEGFSQSCMEALLGYVYSDELPQGLEPSAVVELLHAASYYGTPRLIELCEARLMGELLRLPPAAAAAEAPHLLCLADELGLVQLRRGAVAFIAQHYTEVQACEAWCSLDRSQVELVASQLAAEMARVKQLLSELQPPGGVAAMPKRRVWW